MSDSEDHIGGRPPHEPTDASKRQVESLASFGVPQADIAKVVGISEPTLRKHYREVLDVATVKANSMVAQSLFKKAMGDGREGVTAAIFWLKTRANWKETSVQEIVTRKVEQTENELVDRIQELDRQIAAASGFGAEGTSH